MKRAKDFRDAGWDILRGRYWWAVLAGLIVTLLGGYTARGTVDFNFRTNFNHISQRVQDLTNGQIDVEKLFAIVQPLFGIFAALSGLVMVYGIAMFVVGSAVELGYNRFNVSLYTSKETPKIEDLFSRFSIFGNALLLRLFMLLKTLAWMLLLIIPGIVAAYRYAMAPYIMAEHPEITPMEAIEQSKQMMYGNKGRLFCLQFSFIGWWLLAMITGGIGSVFLVPYVKAATTGFYLDLTGRSPLPQQPNSFSPAAPKAPAAPAASGKIESESGGRELI